MTEFHRYLLHLMTITMLCISMIFIVPNLSNDSSHYKSETKILNDYRFESQFLHHKTQYYLILSMTDGTEWVICDMYSKHWNELRRNENIGKKYKLYLGNNTKYGYNPIQIEIENKVIYDQKEYRKPVYFMLSMTLCLTVFSCYELIKFIKIKLILMS